MSKRIQLDTLCDEMDIKEKKYNRLDLGCRQLQAAIDSLVLVDEKIALDKYEFLQTMEILDAMYDDVIADRAKVEDELKQLAVKFDRLVNEYFEETGEYYYPERDEWPAWFVGAFSDEGEPDSTQD